MSETTLADRIAAARAAAPQVESLKNISSDTPTLPPGEFPMLVTVDVVPAKTTGNNNLLLLCRTIREETGVCDGEEVTLKAGHTCRRYYPLQPSPKQADPMSWAKDIKRMLSNVLDEDELFDDVDLFSAIELFATKTRISLVTVKIEPAQGEYGPSNRPTSFARPDPDALAEFLADAAALLAE